MTSTTSTLTRYRPVVLFTAGAAACFAGYYLYTSSAPPNGLHRSNAVRGASRQRMTRPNTRHPRTQPRFPDGGVDGILERLANVHDDNIVYGEGQYLGTTLQLSLQNIVNSRIREQLTAPLDFTDHDWEDVLDEVHRDFLQYFMRGEFSLRPLSPQELVVIFGWLQERGLSADVIAQGIEEYTGGRPHAGARPSQDDLERPTLLDGSVHVDGTQEFNRRDIAPTEASHSLFGDTEEDGQQQVLKSAVYYIAEERTTQEGVIHRGITCNQCDTKPIRGVRWRCANCPDFDLCSYCEADNRHDKTHIFYKVRVPAAYLGYPRQPLPPVYPGRPDMMPNTIPREVKKRMINEIKNMKHEEIDGLWDQFTCLANKRWEGDPNGIGWAIDRQAFDRALVPQYSRSTLRAPNLIYDRVFAFYDTNGDALIGFEEFLRALSSVHSRNHSIRLRIAFDGYDIDGDGLVTRKDFLRLFRAFYAIQKESTKDFIAVHTESLAVAGALDTISSSQPLGSHFNEVPIEGTRNRPIPLKRRDNFGDTLPMDPIIMESDEGMDRTEFLENEARRANIRRNITDQTDRSNLPRERWERREFYVDVEEGYNPAEHIRSGVRLDETSSMTAADGTYTDATSVNGNIPEPPKASDDGKFPISNGETEKASEDKEDTVDGVSDEGGADTGALSRTSRSSSRVRFQDDVDIETRSNASTHASASSRPTGERWGGYDIPQPEKDLGRELMYQITQQGFNELLDPLFREKEDLAMEAYATQDERRKWRHLVEEHMGKPISSLNSVAVMACQIGVEKFEQDFRRILQSITDQHRMAYQDLGPEQGCLAYLDDVRDAERELLHDNVKITEENSQSAARIDLDNAMGSRQKVIQETWESIRKSLFSTKHLSSLGADEVVLDPNILTQPLEHLLAQAGYEVDGGPVPMESTYTHDTYVDDEYIAAHIADARQQVEAMVQAFEQDAPVGSPDSSYRDPTLPQFRPDTDVGEAIISPLRQDTMMSGAIQSAETRSTSLRQRLREARSTIAGRPISPTDSASSSRRGSTVSSSYFTGSSPSIDYAPVHARRSIVIDAGHPGNTLERSETAEEMIQILQSAAHMQDSHPASIHYSHEDQAAHHAAYMTAAKYFRPDPEVGDREPPAWRLDRLVLLEKHESEMRARNGAGRITYEEFEALVRRDGDVGRLSAPQFLVNRFNLLWWQGDGFKRWCERWEVEREMGWNWR